MDKYEYKLRLEEIKSLNRKGRFQEAAQVADIIDWKKVRNVSTLGIISDVYKVNRRFEDAKAILLLANGLSPQNRRILYSICDLTIKMGQVVEAIEYYKEFVQVAPNDNNKYILLYKIYEAQDINLDERITVLKEYKKREYNEKWAYELAFLYHRVGLATECVEECDQLILWFGEGKYVAKAMELKMRYVPLSPAQQQAYDRIFARQPGQREDPPAGEAKPQDGQKGIQREEDMDIQVKTMDMGKFNTMNLQAALAESMKEVLEPKTAPDPRRLALYKQRSGYSDEEMYGQDTESHEAVQEAVGDGDSQVYEPGLAYGTGVQAGQDSQKFSDTQVYERITGNFAEEGIYGTQEEYTGQPGYGGDDAEYQEDVGRIMQASAGWDVQATGQFDVEEELEAQEQPREQETQNAGKVVSFGRPVVQEAAAKEAAGEDTGTKDDRFGRTEKMAMLLEQEYDGQIGMALPQERPVEKQITGQMSIDDVLAEWENLRKKNEEKRRLETRKWMLQQTGSMFDDFDQVSRDGMLERLQREEALPLEESQKKNVGEGRAKAIGETEEDMTAPADGAAHMVQGVMEETVTGMQEITGQQPGLVSAGKERTIEELIREAEEKQREAQAVLLELEKVRLAARRQAAMPQEMLQQPGVQAQAMTQQQPGVQAQAVTQQPGVQAQAMQQQPGVQAQAVLQQSGVQPQAVTQQSGVQQQPGMPPQSAAGQSQVQQPPAVEQQVVAPQETAMQQAVASQPQAVQYTGMQGAALQQQAMPPQAATPLQPDMPPQAAPPLQSVTQPQGEAQAQPMASAQEGAAQSTVQQAVLQPAATVLQGQNPQGAANVGPAAEVRQAAEETAGNTQELHERIREQQFEEHERNMTQDEKDLFSTFVPTKGAMRQLVKALDSLSLSAYTGNMIITGAPGSDMMKMAKSVVKLMRARDQNFSGKLAKVSGDVLNGKNPMDLISKIPNGALIVEKGGKLSDEGATNLAKALNQEQTGVIVFLLDGKKGVAGLMERCPQLAACFTARFDIAALDTATLVKYGCQYAYNMEYSIDEMGRLALHTRIEDLQTSDHAVTVEEVREIVDEAVDHAERFSVRHFMDVLFRKRYDDDDMIILGERDFI